MNVRKVTVNNKLAIPGNLPLSLSCPRAVTSVFLQASLQQSADPGHSVQMVLSYHWVLQSHKKKPCFVLADLKMDLCYGDKYRKLIRLLICHCTRTSKESHNHACHICLQSLSQIELMNFKSTCPYLDQLPFVYISLSFENDTNMISL